MALLVEGLGIGGETSLEEYIMCPANELGDDQQPIAERETIRLYGPQEGVSWVARPVTGQSTLGLASRQGSTANRNVPLMDPLVTLFGNEKLSETGSMRSMLFPHFDSMFSIAGQQPKNEEWDEESLSGEEGEDYLSYAAAADSDDNLHSPLISRQTTSLEKDMACPASHGSILSMRHDSLTQGDSGEPVDSTGIDGGWQLAWKWSERESQYGRRKEDLKEFICIRRVSLDPAVDL